MSNMTDVITAAVNAVGGPDADWRVQAGVVGLLVVVGAAGLVINKIKKRRIK
jgi:MYXO-CTERM domain-containing protein